MDEIDIKISYELYFNGRMPYRELADKMGLSSIAVHRRVQNLMDIGIIRGFKAGLDLHSMMGVSVAVCGSSKFEDIEKVLKLLEDDGRTSKIIRSPGDFLFVEGALKDISQLDGYSRKIKEICEMKDPRILIPHMVNSTLTKEITISATDKSIVRSLKDDCRKSLSEVADELNIATRTVKRRLDRLLENGAIFLRAEMVPTASGDIISFMFLHLEEDSDRDVIAHRIWKDKYPHVMSMIPLSNEPRLLIANCWAGSMKETEELKKDILSIYPIDRINLNVLYDMHFLETWLDRSIQ